MAATSTSDTLQKISAFYKESYHDTPMFVAIAPGRVNLIGEHVDHQGYSCLPVALNQSIEVAIGVGQKPGCLLDVKHRDGSFFPPVTFSTYDDIKVVDPPSWTNYLVAALFGVLEYAAFNDSTLVGTGIERLSSMKGKVLDAAKKLLPANGLRICMDGRVPLAAGVSSSSAAVVAATLALTNALGVKMSRELLANVCANSERHVGTAGGGMDQAAICLSKRGMARLIHFCPLRTEAIPLPPDGVLVICNTGRESPKAVQAATCYNKRVFELKLACYILLRALFPHEEIPKEKIPSLTLRYVQERLNVTCKEAAELAKQHLPAGNISRAEAAEILGKNNLDFLINSRVGPAVWERNIYFRLLPRVLHVYSESDRVAKFAETCRDTSLDEEERLKIMGQLMNASDHSLALDFGCGCPELDEVTSLARSLGAYGSRMTGAGWGGCTVSLVHKDNLKHFMEGMKAYFDRPNRLIPITIPQPLDRALFAVIPGDGARLYQGSSLEELLWE